MEFLEELVQLYKDEVLEPMTKVAKTCKTLKEMFKSNHDDSSEGHFDYWQSKPPSIHNTFDYWDDTEPVKPQK
jgi:hypothetical protein